MLRLQNSGREKIILFFLPTLKWMTSGSLCLRICFLQGDKLPGFYHIHLVFFGMVMTLGSGNQKSTK